jgi:adenylate cyclase
VTSAAEDAGRAAVQGVKVKLARGVAQLLKRDPEHAARAVEMGFISRDWLDRPGEAPVSEATPVDVLERILQRSVEQKPSVLATLGLTTLQALSWRGEDASDEGVPVRLAVAFTDLEGFTGWTAAEGDAAASQLLADHHRAVGPVVRSRGGRVVKRLGDGLLLTFATPEAAVLACLDLVAIQPEPLRLRAGVHVGDVLLTRDDVLGHVVNVAARVTESARGGEVMATDAVEEAVADLPSVSFGRLRRRRFKGVEEVVRVGRVLPVHDTGA